MVLRKYSCFRRNFHDKKSTEMYEHDASEKYQKGTHCMGDMTGPTCSSGGHEEDRQCRVVAYGLHRHILIKRY